MINARSVILSGGAGTRLWPLSRSGFPKQFLCLIENESLLQQTARRLVAVGNEEISLAPPYVVCNEDHRFLASEQFREVDLEVGAVLLEPVGRNTAPALTFAALAAIENGDDPVLVVTPADQVIADEDAFVEAMRSAVREAARGTIIILGVVADRPETGYGYIKVQNCSPSLSCTMIVERFVEKPDAPTADSYLSEGGYYWNAGVFVLKASVWLAALKCFRPDIASATLESWSRRSTDASFIRPGKSEFLSIPSESVDYAVLEQCPGSQFPISMVPLDAGWSDVGSWDVFWSVQQKDETGNVCLGDVLAIDTRNTLVHATSRLVGLVGVQDLVVIETPDAILVANISRSQDVKHIVNMLTQQKREEHLFHRKVYRPWGWYDCVDKGHRFKVKRILVKPKASLSLQKHHHRAEHWIVVKGTAEIVCGDKIIVLTENQSTFIPLGESHRLTNPGEIPLEIIEVQSGSYLGEDDIVRIKDIYGRS